MANKRSSETSSAEASKATPARKAAYALVSAVRQRDSYLSSLIPEILESYSLTSSDKAFAYLLAQGTVSLQVSLDAMIDRALRTPADVKADVRDALRIAAYEILYLGKEDHAAVDQGVELVRAVAPRATGVANFVLHRIVEEKGAYPFGDPTASLRAAALYYGFPEWLARAIEAELGLDGALLLMRESLDAAPVWFSANELVFSSEELAAELKRVGIEYNTCKPLISGTAAEGVIIQGAASEDATIEVVGEGAGENPAPQDCFCNNAEIFQLTHRSDVGNPAFLALLETDKIVVSDLSAQSIVLAAASKLPLDNASILEIGAGRGTKTLQIQSACKRLGVNLATYDAIDLKRKKIHQLEDRMQQTGGLLSHAIAHDATKPYPQGISHYDLVFIDAPCTGVGTLRRHPEIKARLGEKDSAALARIGLAMLSQAAAHVKPGGTLIYSTCTIFREENEDVIERFLATPEGANFEILPLRPGASPLFRTPLALNGPDLHYTACLCKSP